MAKSNLNQYENGQVLDHERECCRLYDDCIMNKHHVFIKNEADVEKHCGACVKSSVCVALLNNYNSSFNKNKGYEKK